MAWITSYKKGFFIKIYYMHVARTHYNRNAQAWSTSYTRVLSPRCHTYVACIYPLPRTHTNRNGKAWSTSYKRASFASMPTCDLHTMHTYKQICQGMEHLIQEGILHRDLAARNVLLFSFDQHDPLTTSVKVADFGLSVGTYSQTHMYGAQGECRPVRYMPPETLRKARYIDLQLLVCIRLYMFP